MFSRKSTDNRVVFFRRHCAARNLCAPTRVCKFIAHTNFAHMFSISRDACNTSVKVDVIVLFLILVVHVLFSFSEEGSAHLIDLEVSAGYVPFFSFDRCGRGRPTTSCRCPPLSNMCFVVQLHPAFTRICPRHVLLRLARVFPMCFFRTRQIARWKLSFSMRAGHPTVASFLIHALKLTLTRTLPASSLLSRHVKNEEKKKSNTQNGT